MSISSINAQQFYKEIIKEQKVYTIKDKGGFPAPINLEGFRAQPFWSSSLKGNNIITNVTEYKEFQIFEISLNDFIDKWLIGLSKDNILVGLNWSGDKVTGYDIPASDVLENINYYLK